MYGCFYTMTPQEVCAFVVCRGEVDTHILVTASNLDTREKNWYVYHEIVTVVFSQFFAVVLPIICDSAVSVGAYPLLNAHGLQFRPRGQYLRQLMFCSISAVHITPCDINV